MFYKNGEINKKKRMETKLKKNIVFLTWINKENKQKIDIMNDIINII